MIDVKKTITSSIKDRIDKLRKLGENNINAFKKILYLIVLDDVYDWSGYLDAPQKVQRQLKEARIQFILNNPELIMEREQEVYENALGESIIIKHRQPYVNVNTPQTNDTWKRVWDNLGGSGNILDVDIPQITPTPPTSWELDPSCKIERYSSPKGFNPSFTICFASSNETSSMNLDLDVFQRALITFSNSNFLKNLGIYIPPCFK